MKKKQLVVISLSAIMTLGVVTTALFSGNAKSPFVVAEGTDRVLTINDSEDEDNHLIDENQSTAVEKQTTIYTTLGNPIKINSYVTYLSATKSLYLNKNNYIANDYSSPIGSMKSIKVTGNNQALTLHYGWDDGAGAIDYHVSTSFRSSPYGGTFEFSSPYPSYFKIVGSTTGSTNIYEVAIKYADDCENIANPYVTVGGIDYTITGSDTVTAAGLADSSTVNVVIPDEIIVGPNTYKVTEVGEKAFYYNEKIQTVTLGNNIKKIANYAFAYCTKLTTLNWCNEITHIGEYAFQYCREMQIAGLPSKLEFIGRYAFYTCSKITEIAFPSTIKTISNASFMSSGLACDIVLPEGLKYVEDAAFRSTKITSINIPASCDAFYENLTFTPELASLTVSEDNRYYKAVDNVLYNKAMTRLIHIASKKTGDYVMPDTVTYVVDYAGDSSSLTSVTFNNVVDCVASSFMSNNKNLTTINFGSKIKSIGNYAFSNCTSLTSITIPGTIKNIQGHAFAYDTLTTVTLEEGVETIYCRAFKDAVIGRFNMPKSVTSIAYLDEYNSWEPAFNKEVAFYFADTEEEAAAKTNWKEGWAGGLATFNYAA